jgi:hypothetical protein
MSTPHRGAQSATTASGTRQATRPRDKLGSNLFTGLSATVFVILLSCVVAAAVMFNAGY